jgi:hypothetical protein
MKSAAFDLAASRLVMHTKATGLLARFAHNLELEATRFEAELGADGERWVAELRVPVRGLRVVGVRRGERVDKDTLSGSDQDEIHRRLLEQVFVGTDTVSVHAQGEARERGSAKVALHSGTQTVALRSTLQPPLDGKIVVSGRCTLSLRALGVPEVKGPLGAFKVHDDVEVIYSFAVTPES